MFLNIKCKLCRQIFQDPVILPCCNQTICFKHIEIKSKYTKYQCNLCNEYTHLPVYGFRYDNKAIKFFLLVIVSIIIFGTRLNQEINLDNYTYDAINCQAKQSCSKLEDLIKKSEHLANDPKFYIKEHFNQLKNEITSKKLEYISKIEQNYQNNLNDLKQLENQCLESNIQQKSLLFHDLIQTTKFKVNKWKQDLKVLHKTNEQYWKRIHLRAEQENSKLINSYQNLQNDLLLNKEFTFKPQPILNGNNFGQIQIINKEKLDSKRSEATFQLIINNFNQFKTTNDLTESINACFIQNIPWRLQAQIEQTDDYDLGLAVYVRPDLDTLNILLNPINAKIKLKLLSVNAELKFEKLFTYRFEDNSGRGFSPFILLRNIMTQSNGIINNNSIIIEANVKVY